MMLEYAGDKLAKESNVSFFDSSGTPPTVIFVQGEESRDGMGKISFKVPQLTVDRIADTLKSDKGHRHRVALIPVPPGTKTDAVKLGEFSTRDVGFTTYRQDNARRTLSSFRLQPVFVPAVSDSVATPPRSSGRSRWSNCSTPSRPATRTSSPRACCASSATDTCG